ncbi:MAG: ParA family protein [Pyrinomonadaceae bacterium]|nr:ParA family protein [Pyrinomonadaceae bacterium]MDQ3133643.1 ParA family protein [Acidobacteriota bacterium]
MKTIVLANHKGGCAKTTTALNIAVALAAQGSRVLAVDLDPQGNLSAVFGVDLEELEESRRTSMRLMLDPQGDFSEYVSQVRPRVDIIPCCLDDEAEAVITAADSRELLLKEKLEPAQAGYDYCVIDTPPSLGTPTLNALAMSDLTIVPIDTGLFALLGIKQLLRKVTRISKRYSPQMQILALSTKYTSRQKLDREVRERVLARFGEDYVFQTTVPKLVAVEEATATLKAVGEAHAESPATFAFRKLVKEIREVLGDEEVGAQAIVRNAK